MYKVPCVLLLKARGFSLIVFKQKLCYIKYSRICILPAAGCLARHCGGAWDGRGATELPCFMEEHRTPTLASYHAQGLVITTCVTAGPLPFTTVLLQMPFCLISHACRPCYKLGLLFRSSVTAAEAKQSHWERLYQLFWVAPAVTSVWVNSWCPVSHLGFSTVSSKGDDKVAFQPLLIYMIPFIFSRPNMVLWVGCQGCSSPKIKNNCSHYLLALTQPDLGPPWAAFGVLHWFCWQMAHSSRRMLH